MANHLPDDLYNEIIAWLPWASPDEWHRVAFGWNWGFGSDILRWITRQPECDKATALLIFWYGEPSYYWSDNLEQTGNRLADRSSNNDDFHLLGEIMSSWRSKSYTRAELAFDPRSLYIKPEYVEKSANHPTLAITADMIQPLRGRTLAAAGDFIEGLPPHIKHIN